MRKNIGWQERQDGIKFDIRVRFDGGERILWQHISKELNRWERFEATPEQWQLLLEKVTPAMFAAKRHTAISSSLSGLPPNILSSRETDCRHRPARSAKRLPLSRHSGSIRTPPCRRIPASPNHPKRWHPRRPHPDSSSLHPGNGQLSAHTFDAMGRMRRTLTGSRRQNSSAPHRQAGTPPVYLAGKMGGPASDQCPATDPGWGHRRRDTPGKNSPCGIRPGSPCSGTPNNARLPSDPSRSTA